MVELCPAAGSAVVAAEDAVVAFCASAALAQQPADGDKLNRTVLPIPEPQYPHSNVLDVRNVTPPPRFEVKASAA